MTETLVDIAYGDELWIGRTTVVEQTPTTTWTEVRGIETLNFPSKPPEDVDATHMKSPGRSRETIPGLLPVGDWSQDIQMWIGSPEDTLLEELAEQTEEGTREIVYIEFHIVGGARRTYTGYVNEYTPQGTVGDKRMVTLGLKLFAREETNPRTIPG